MKPETKRLWLRSAAASTVAVGLGLIGYVLNHSALSEGVFLLVPFCAGLALAFISKRKEVVSMTAATSVLLTLVFLLITGLQGLGCIMMVFPIIFLGIGLGAVTGFFIGRKFSHKYGNIAVIAICLGAMTLVGWTRGKPSSPQLLTITTTMDFLAPMDEVWRAIRESDNIDGDASALRVLGLPVPYRCSISDDGTRVCYFEEGEMIQKVTHQDFGESFRVKIIKCTFAVRDWLSFVNAAYHFVQKDGYVQVTREDTITSTLRPRWYWHWFEEKCVQLEHSFVMSSMKRKAEQAAQGGRLATTSRSLTDGSTE